MRVHDEFATRTAVEVDLAMAGADCGIARLTAEVGSRLIHQPGLDEAGESDGRVFVATGADPATLVAASAASDGLVDPRLVTVRDGTAVLELTAADATVDAVAAEVGGWTRRLVAADGRLDTTVLLPDGDAVRSLHDALESQFGPVSLLAQRHGVPQERTRPEFLERIEDALTERQLTALRTAHSGGFFDWPREISGEDLAASMDITPSTYHQHLRAAERKVFDALFER